MAFASTWGQLEIIILSESEVAQSCPTLRNPMDCGPPGSSGRGVSQAGRLEWATVSVSFPPVISWTVSHASKFIAEALNHTT